MDIGGLCFQHKKSVWILHSAGVEDGHVDGSLRRRSELLRHGVRRSITRIAMESAF
jgi:hypothetical protein